VAEIRAPSIDITKTFGGMRSDSIRAEHRMASNNVTAVPARFPAAGNVRKELRLSELRNGGVLCARRRERLAILARNRLSSRQDGRFSSRDSHSEETFTRIRAVISEGKRVSSHARLNHRGTRTENYTFTRRTAGRENVIITVPR